VCVQEYERSYVIKSSADNTCLLPGAPLKFV
jgi:hypothetical protein